MRVQQNRVSRGETRFECTKNACPVHKESGEGISEAAERQTYVPHTQMVRVGHMMM